MAVNEPKPPKPAGPKFPRESRSRKPGEGQMDLFTGQALQNIRKPQRAKPISQTEYERKKSVQGVAKAAPPPIRAVRARGSNLGQLQPDDSQIDFPQIDPTHTTNPARPRTLQAGYERARGAATGTLRVRFRDGTPWEYYNVPPNVWRNMKRVKSPGRLINRVLNGYDYGRGNF